MTGILSYNDLYQTVADLEANYRKPMPGVDHAVVITGYQDDANVPSGGYWIIKNSWGTGGGDNGYWFIPYGDVENHVSTQAYSGTVYYTGPMYHTGPWDATGVDYTGTAATNTWKGTTNGTWDTTSGTSGNWSNNATGQAFTWVNQELQAAFDNTGTNRAITVSGTVIAHGLTFNSGATGYSFSGGSLTVTAGGIQANESVSFSSPVYIGGPQSWNVACGKTLTVTGPLHTIISDLTFSGAGTTTISGEIDGGGVLNTQEARAGRPDSSRHWARPSDRHHQFQRQHHGKSGRDALYRTARREVPPPGTALSLAAARSTSIVRHSLLAAGPRTSPAASPSNRRVRSLLCRPPALPARSVAPQQQRLRYAKWTRHHGP